MRMYNYMALYMQKDGKSIIRNFVHGHHVHKDKCSPELGKTLQCIQEEGNTIDYRVAMRLCTCFAVAVRKSHK